MSAAMVWRLTLWGTIGALFCATVGAWGSDPVELHVWGQGFGPETKGLEAAVREFERRNPDVRVRMLSMGAGAMNPQKLMTSIVGKAPPDVIRQDRFTIGDWASRGAFLDLSPYIERDMETDPLSPRPEQYYPETWAEVSYRKGVFAIPTSFDNRALYWNKNIFRESSAALRKAGLDPSRPPRTWEELLAYSKVLTQHNADGTLRQAGFLPNFGNSWLYLYAFQQGAEFMSPDGRTCTLYTPESAKALQFMVEGYEVVGGYEKALSFQSGFQSNMNDPFIVGKVAMKIDGDWILANLARYGPQLDFGVAPPPVPEDRYRLQREFAGETERFVTWSGGFSLAIPEGARHPEQAWRFVKWMTSLEGRLLEAGAQRDWEEKRGRLSIPRQNAHRKANEIIFLQLKPKQAKFADALQVHVDLAPAAKIRPVTFVGQILWDEHVRATERACLKLSPPERALKAGQAVVQREIDEFFRMEQYPPASPFVLVGFGVLLGGAAVAWFVVRTRRERVGQLSRQSARWGYLLISPWLVGFGILTLGPMIASLVLSFTHYPVLSEPRWVGTDNFADLFTADWPNVKKSLANAAYLAGVGVPLSLLTGLSIALLLNSAVRGLRYYRTFFYMPAIVPTIASAVLWAWLLSGDPNKGLINAVWLATVSEWFGTPVPGWINAEAWAKPALILMGVWGAGSGMILWLAGLKGIPTSLYEAAAIDGANPRQQFWTVTLPQLSPIIFFNLVMGIIGSLQEFDRVYVMRTPDGTPGPADSLLVPVYHLFVNGFSYFKMGYASAFAWLLFAIILILTAIQLKLAPKWVHYEAEN